MRWDDVFMFILIFFVVVVPILGLTARFALAPLLNALAGLRNSFNEERDSALLERRILQLEDELQTVRSELAALSETAAFDRDLARRRQSLEPSRS